MPHSGWYPPKNTAWWLLMAVKEKPLQGGGLEPVVGGEDHLPEKGEVTRLVLPAFLVKCS